MALNILPNELVLVVIRFLMDAVGGRRHLKSFCLVSHQCRQIAQPLLFERISVRSHGNLIRLHASLTGSDLGRCVRDLMIELCYEHDPSNLRKPSTLIGDCLEKTTRLEKVAFGRTLQKFITNSVIKKVSSLPRLKTFAIAESTFLMHNDSGQSFDRRLLLDLPKTIEKLELQDPSTNLLSLLPEICANLQNPQSTTNGRDSEQSALFLKTGERATHTTGLRSLTIQNYYDHQRLSTFHQAPFSALGNSLATTLTSFTLNSTPPSDMTVLIRFLSATPLVEHLRLIGIKTRTPLFDGLPPLSKLYSLAIHLDSSRDSDGVDELCTSLANFLSGSPRLQALIFTDNDMKIVSTLEILADLIAATTNSSASPQRPASPSLLSASLRLTNAMWE